MALIKKSPVAVLLLAVLLVASGCSKYEKKGYMQQGGIAITFDDDRIDNWFKYLPFFDSTGIRATFYICKYHLLSPAQKNKLRILKDHGHEIAYHTSNHYNMVEYLVKNHHTLDELISKEIEYDLNKMERDGFYPKTFAYPYGAHSGELDHLLLKRYFKSVRALNGGTNYSASLAPLEKNNDILYGFGLDKSSNHSDDCLTKVMQSAKNNNCCAIFVAHDINKDGKLSVTLDRLKRIVNTVKELDLKYYTVSEISN
jgi:peptidoglycan/xylan/chitin deacetylase (PgdA/CDA1 family)